MPAGMVPYPFAPVVTVQGAGATLVDLVSSDPSVNDSSQLTIENSTAAGTPGILFKQTNGFNSGGAAGIFQWNGPDFAGTNQEYGAAICAEDFQKVGALGSDYELNFRNNNTFYTAIIGGVVNQWPVPLTSCTLNGGGAIGATTATLSSATGWPADGALDLYGFLHSTNNGNSLDEEFVHITNKTGTAITISATKAAHTTAVTLAILDPTQGPAIYHAPANGVFYSGNANGTNPTPMSLGCGAAPWAGIFLNPNFGPEGAGTTYQITKNDFYVIAQKAVTYTLPPILPTSSTIGQYGQILALFANGGNITLNTSAATSSGLQDEFRDASVTRTITAVGGIVLISQPVPSPSHSIWFPLATIPAL